MPSPYTRIADDLNRSVRQFGAHPDVTATDDGVVIPALTARKVTSALGFMQGGMRVPFVSSLLGRGTADTLLRGDEGLHLVRALDDIARQAQRRRRIDHGQIPGALSSSEVTHIARTQPWLLGGR